VHLRAKGWTNCLAILPLERLKDTFCSVSSFAILTNPPSKDELPLLNNRLQMNMFLAKNTTLPRRVLALICLGSVAMLALGLYLQHLVGLEPCPMCIVQRYALVLVALFAGIFTIFKGRVALIGGSTLIVLSAGFGVFVAARQSWLQWFPPEVASCGRDFYGMIETFPLQRVIPMIFKGSGDCSKVDWTLWGLSIANWSFMAFLAICLVTVALIFRLARKHVR
jgi:disulfide bond formation protein DsbB